MPLALSNKQDSQTAEAFQLIIDGKEIVKGYSEENDAVIQKKKFLLQAKDGENIAIDEEYIRDLGYGMPPTGGAGLGLNRLRMFVEDDIKTIRDTVAFSNVKSEESVVYKERRRRDGQEK